MLDYRRNQVPPIVIVTADNGTVREWPLAEFEADPVACVAATGNGITPPTPEPTVDDLRKQIATLEKALITKAVIVQKDIDDAKVAVAVVAEEIKP